MAPLTILPMVILLASNAMADIIVQPGYGQPHAALESHLIHHQHPVTEPPELIPHTQLGMQNHNQQYSMDPGYHLELHPVYTHSYHIPAHALTPMYHYLTPPMSKTAYRRLFAKNAGLGVAAMPPAIAPEYYPYAPTAVHSRSRRSNPEEPAATAQRDKHDKADVAKESTLANDALPINDSQNQDEKRVNTRQSMTSGLFGLNPTNMYPVYGQFRPVELDPTLNAQPEITNQQTLSQINSRATIQDQSTQQQTPTLTQTVPRIHIGNHPHAMLLQHPAPQQQQKVSEQRNIPDPRPISISLQSSPNTITDSSTDNNGASQTSMKSQHAEESDDKEIVGAKMGMHKTKIVHHLHEHAKFKNLGHKSHESYTNVNPSYPMYNQGAQNNLATTQTAAPQVLQISQVPYAQPTNYSPTTQYVVVPQTYPLNYAANYGTNYAYNPPSTAPSPLKIWLQTSGNAQPIVYQLA